MTFPLNYVTPDSLSNGDCMDKFDAATRWAGTFPVRVGGHTVIPSKPGKKTPGILSYREYTGSGSRAPTNSEVVSWREQARREGGEPLLLCDHPTDPSRSLAVVDVDDPAYFPVFEAAMATYGVDASAAMIVTTGREGGGRHYYFRREPMEALAYSQANGARAFLDRMGHSPVDLKGVRCYVVCPGATHKSGRVYEATVNGQPVPSLAEVVASLPVMPLKVWQAMKAPSAFLVTDESPSGAELGTFSFDDYAPAAQAAYGKVSDSGWSTVWRPTSHPAYSVFSPLVGRKTSLYVDPATGEVGTGDSPTGRLVSRNARGELVVTDWALMVHTIFTDAERKPPVPHKAQGTNSPEKVRDHLRSLLGEGGRIEPLEMNRKGYITPGDALARVEVVRCGRGRGKTEAASAIAAKFKKAGGRVVVVAPLRSLVAQAASRFQTPSYKDSKGFISGDVAVCAPSLRRVSLIHDTGDLCLDIDTPMGASLLVVDEIEQTLQMITGGMLKWNEAKGTLVSLIAAVRSFSRVILVDADAGALTAQFIRVAGLDAETVWRTGPGDQERELVRVDGGKAAALKNLIARGLCDMPCAVACLSREAGEDIASALRKEFPAKKVVLLTKYTVPGEYKGVDISADDFHKDVDFFIYTPIVSTGLSIDIKNHYWESHLVTDANVGDGLLALQMLHRVRNPIWNSVKVYGTLQKAPAPWKMDPEEIKKVALRNANFQKSLIPETRTVETEAPTELMHSEESRMLFDLCCLAEAESNKNGKGWVFRWFFGDAIDGEVARKPTPEEVAAKKVLAAERDEKHEAEALAEVSVAPRDCIGVDLDDEATPAPVAACAFNSLAFGRAYELASDAERLEIARENRTGALAQKTKRRAEFLSFLGADGVRTPGHLQRLDGWELEKGDLFRVRNKTLGAALTAKVYRALGVDPRSTVDQPLKVAKILEAVRVLKSYKAELDAVGITIQKDVDAKPLTLIGDVLSRVNERVVSKKVRVKADPEKGIAAGFTRTYTIIGSETERANLLAQEALGRILNPDAPKRLPGTYDMERAMKAQTSAPGPLSWEAVCGPSA